MVEPTVPCLNEPIPMTLGFVTGAELPLHKDSPIRTDESATEALWYFIYSNREVRCGIIGRGVKWEVVLVLLKSRIRLLTALELRLNDPIGVNATSIVILVVSDAHVSRVVR